MNIFLDDMPDRVKVILHYADNALILSQRLSEWCGHGPILEQDIALTNIALDLLGQARLYYQYAAELEGKTEDDYPYHRDDRSFLNSLLVEQENGNWGDTIVRQYLFDQYHYLLLTKLLGSTDSRLSDIAEKSLKEVAYHLRFSSEWLIRLGDGTDESHDKIQEAMNNLFRFSRDAFKSQDYEKQLISEGVIPDMEEQWNTFVHNVKVTTENATIEIPETKYFQYGGKKGQHTEYLGFLLAEMQHLQRTYPGLNW